MGSGCGGRGGVTILDIKKFFMEQIWAYKCLSSFLGVHNIEKYKEVSNISLIWWATFSGEG